MSSCSTDKYVKSISATNGTSAASTVEGGLLSFQVELNAANTKKISLDFDVKGLSASQGSDFTSSYTFTNGVTYNAKSGTLSIPAGVTSFTISIPTVNDSKIEANETLKLSVGNLSATGTIIDNDRPTPTVQAQAASIQEGAQAVFSVTLDKAVNTSQKYAFDLTGLEKADIASMTFTNGVKYDAKSGTVSVPAGVTAFDVVVATTNDLTYDEQKTLSVSVGQSTASTLVIDNDAAPIANNDGAGTPYTVNIGTSYWSNKDSFGQPVQVNAIQANGQPGTVYFLNANGGMGVYENARNPSKIDAWPSQQLEYNDVTGLSEKLVFDFSGNMNKASITLSNLFIENGTPEVAIWVAMFDGSIVATGQINGTTYGNPTAQINTGDKAFNQIIMLAKDYVANDASLGGADTSEYFITQIIGSGPASMNSNYQTAEDQTLTIDAFSSGLLANDVDANGVALSVTSVEGSQVSANGSTVVHLEKGDLTINADGTFSFTPNLETRVRMQAGDVESQTFSYTIANANGNTLVNGGSSDSQATATITIIGKSDATNTAPTSTASQLSTDEDVTKVLALSDFGNYQDAEANAFLGVKITEVPANGQLMLNGVAVIANQVITAEAINAGQLSFVPTANSDTDTAFGFQVTDGNAWSATYQADIIVKAVADAPTISLSLSKASKDEDCDDGRDHKDRNDKDHDQSKPDSKYYQEVKLKLAAALTDTDGSESLTVSLVGLPNDAILSYGTKNADGSWSIDVAAGQTQLQQDLSVYLTKDSKNVDITAIAQSTEHATADNQLTLASASATDDLTLNPSKTHDHHDKLSDLFDSALNLIDFSSIKSQDAQGLWC